MNFFTNKFQQLILQVGVLVTALAPALTQANMPVFTPFDWSTQPKYIIQGTSSTYVPGIGEFDNIPVTFVIDPPNKRLLLVVGNQKQYIMEHESFITNVVPGCAKVLKADGTNFTFDDQVAGYLNVRSHPKSTIKKPYYFGLAADVASCQDKLAIEIYLRKGYLLQFNFAQLFPIGPECSYVTGFIKFDYHSIDTTSSTDPYFVLDSNCTDSSASFCSQLFYPGNPCSNCNLNP